MIDKKYIDSLIEEYGSRDSVLDKLPECEYCVFKKVLRDYQKQIKVLERPLPKGQRPHRGFIEDACGEKQDEVPCPLKYCVERMEGVSDSMVAQWAAVKIFKIDLGKYYGREFEFPEAFKEWNKDRISVENEKGNPTSYAYRFTKIWDEAADLYGEDTLNSEGIYRISVSKNGTFKKNLDNFNILKEEEEERDKKGLELLI